MWRNRNVIYSTLPKGGIEMSLQAVLGISWAPLLRIYGDQHKYSKSYVIVSLFKTHDFCIHIISKAILRDQLKFQFWAPE